MTKLITFIIFIFSILFFSSCKTNCTNGFTPINKNSKIKIIVTSDLHFISSKSIHPESLINKPNYYGDGRIIVYNETLIDAFCDKVLNEKPDCLIITGDLNFNGSVVNHQELVYKLNKLIKAGIRVLVIPGNHDLNDQNSYYYNQDKVEAIQTTTSKKFTQIYYNYGYQDSLLKDKDSLSYAYQLSDDLMLLMLDSCIYQDNHSEKTLSRGIIKSTTMDFIDKSLAYAKKMNMDVITCSHHNLFIHNELFVASYQIANHQELVDLLNKYQVKLHLSGHMHIQHIKEEQNITEILSSSLAMYEHHYGVINYIPHESFDYHTELVNVDEYAKKIGSNNQDLLNFQAYSFDFFTKSSYLKTVENILFNDSSLYDIADAAGRAQSILNPAYFSGKADTVIAKVINDPGYSLWHNDNFISNCRYIVSMMESNTNDHNNVKVILSNKDEVR